MLKKPLLSALLSCFMLFNVAYAASFPEFTQLVESAAPAVVNISTVHKMKPGDGRNRRMMEEFEGTPFFEFFKRFGPPHFSPDAPEEDIRSLGSGFIITNDGYIITNNHVIDDADQIIVRLNDRRELDAKLVGADPDSDLALLKIEASDLPILKLSDRADVKVGEWVIAIGSPFGFDHSVTAGIVSATGRSFLRERYVPFIQTDVAINPGNSGGPLVNMDGEVIGVNSHIVTQSGQYAGLSFSIPADVVKTVTKQLREDGKVTRGWLGLTFQDMTRELAETFGLKKPMGALVTQVLPDSPAAAGGIRQGDVIINFNGADIERAESLPHLVGRVKPGTKVNVEVIRERKSKTLKLAIGTLPDEERLASSHGVAKGGATMHNLLGIAVRELKESEKTQLEGAEGVLIEDVQRGPAGRAGVRPGDVVLALNHTPTPNVSSFKKASKRIEKGDTVPMLIMRPGSGQRYVAITITD